MVQSSTTKEVPRGQTYVRGVPEWRPRKATVGCCEDKAWVVLKTLRLQRCQRIYAKKSYQQEVEPDQKKEVCFS